MKKLLSIIIFLIILPTSSYTNENIQGLGWLVRRSIDPILTGEFYTQILGLPELRRRDNEQAKNIMLWAGRYSVIATNVMEQNYYKINNIEDAEIIPIFRARNIESMKSILKSQKIVFISSLDVDDKTIYFLDPSGFVIGIRPAIPKPTLKPDLYADTLWNDKHNALKGMKNLHGNIQDIGWLRMNVKDPQILAEFYNEVVGLDILNNRDNTVTLHLGGTLSLELMPGGKDRLKPTDRKQVPDVWILRGYQISKFNDKMKKFNVPIINRLNLVGGKLNYYLDPEGNVFGYQERKEYVMDDERTQRIEDLAARRHWWGNNVKVNGDEN